MAKINTKWPKTIMMRGIYTKKSLWNIFTNVGMSVMKSFKILRPGRRGLVWL